MKDQYNDCPLCRGKLIIAQHTSYDLVCSKCHSYRVWVNVCIGVDYAYKIFGSINSDRFYFENNIKVSRSKFGTKCYVNHLVVFSLKEVLSLEQIKNKIIKLKLFL